MIFFLKNENSLNVKKKYILDTVHHTTPCLRNLLIFFSSNFIYTQIYDQKKSSHIVQVSWFWNSNFFRHREAIGLKTYWINEIIKIGFW